MMEFIRAAVRNSGFHAGITVAINTGREHCLAADITRCCGRASHVRRYCRQSGASLIISLLMLMAVMLLGLSAAQIALSSEKASRNDRDRQVAFQAAEATLIDAEIDIQNSPDAGLSRSQLFSKDSALGFPAETDLDCGAGLTNQGLGLCSRRPAGMTPAWQTVNFSNVDVNSTQSVPYGTFTGQLFTVGSSSGGGGASIRTPRYVIELMNYTEPGASAEKVSFIYRITAIGYGVRDSTQVVLQSFYRKES